MHRDSNGTLSTDAERLRCPLHITRPDPEHRSEPAGPAVMALVAVTLIFASPSPIREARIPGGAS